MDPLSTATAFATVVGLVGNFAASRRGAESATYEEFMSWLTERNHQELVALISSNSTTSISIKALLGETRDVLIQRLESLDAAIAQLASGYGAFRDLAESFYPDSELSEQAISLVEQFVSTGAVKVLPSRYIGGMVALHVVDGAGGQLKYTEPRFLDDDLNTLVELGLLRLDHNSKGQPLYVITRQAVKFVEARRK